MIPKQTHGDVLVLRRIALRKTDAIILALKMVDAIFRRITKLLQKRAPIGHSYIVVRLVEYWVLSIWCTVLVAVSYTHLDVYKRQSLD